jgi:hypothetical protein
MPEKLTPSEMQSLRERTAKGVIPSLEEVARYVATIRVSYTSAAAKAKPKNRLAAVKTSDEDMDGVF